MPEEPVIEPWYDTLRHQTAWFHVASLRNTCDPRLELNNFLPQSARTKLNQVLPGKPLVKS